MKESLTGIVVGDSNLPHVVQIHDGLIERNRMNIRENADDVKGIKTNIEKINTKIWLILIFLAGIFGTQIIPFII